MELKKTIELVGMLYGFRRTPPGSQEERREDPWREGIGGLTRCQAQTPPGAGNTGG